MWSHGSCLSPGNGPDRQCIWLPGVSGNSNLRQRRSYLRDVLGTDGLAKKFTVPHPRGKIIKQLDSP
jgi:hypothetical protein